MLALYALIPTRRALTSCIALLSVLLYLYTWSASWWKSQWINHSAPCHWQRFSCPMCIFTERWNVETLTLRATVSHLLPGKCLVGSFVLHYRTTPDGDRSLHTGVKVTRQDHPQCSSHFEQLSWKCACFPPTPLFYDTTQVISILPLEYELLKNETPECGSPRSTNSVNNKLSTHTIWFHSEQERIQIFFGGGEGGVHYTWRRRRETLKTSSGDRSGEVDPLPTKRCGGAS